MQRKSTKFLLCWTLYIFGNSGLKIVPTEKWSIWMWVAEKITGNVVITRRSHGGRAEVCWGIYNDITCKKQWWARYIYGEEFQRVGRTVFIKTKMLLFPYIIIISTQSYNPFKVIWIYLRIIKSEKVLKMDFKTIKLTNVSNYALTILWLTSIIVFFVLI